jgi:hypothetical protein
VVAVRHLGSSGLAQKLAVLVQPVEGLGSVENADTARNE